MAYHTPFEPGDLIEYMRGNRPRRSQFGIVLSTKKIIGAWQLEVMWGDTTSLVDSRYVEKR